MPRQTGLPAALARFGLKVELSPGWETRGAATFNPRGAVSHWTAGPKKSTTRPSLNICINGRAGLPGPLCNVYLDRNGVAVVVAAGTANHAGVGGWKGLTGNSQVFGTEAECGGDSDWTPAQRVAYPKVNAAYCWLGKFGADMVCGHNEWAPTRKIDIRDWPMSAMRAQVAAILANPTASATTGDWFDMATQAEVRALIDDALRPIYDTLTPGKAGVKNTGDVWGKVTAGADAGAWFRRVLGYKGHHAKPDDDVIGHVLSIRQAIDRILERDTTTPASAAVGNVDAATLARELAHTPGFVDTLAEAFAQNVAERFQT
jgi:hypothetical protein